MTDFKITRSLPKIAGTFLHSQLFVTPPYPEKSFQNQTVIVTGGSAGLGLEASKHFYRLGAAKLILAIRTVSKGQAAKEEIVKTVPTRTDADAIEIWELDLSSTASTLAFADRVATLDRVDVIVENAGQNNQKWLEAEGTEMTMQVNVLNTSLLALLVYPVLAASATKHSITPHLTIVSSEVHRFTGFPEINSPDIYAKFNSDKSSYVGQDRYNVSKLVGLLFMREFVKSLPAPSATSPHVPVVTYVNPGLNRTTMAEENASFFYLVMGIVMKRLIGRKPDVGSRTIVAGASAGPASHGEFMSDSKNQDVEPWIYTEGGQKIQKRVFDETMKILEARKPGVSKIAGITK